MFYFVTFASYAFPLAKHQRQRLHPRRQSLIRLLHHQQRNSDDWHQTRRTGLEQLPITKLQLFYLVWTVYWNAAILPKFRQRVMLRLSVDWHFGKTDNLPLWHSISLHPSITSICREGFFRCAGTCVLENETEQVPDLSSVHFWEWTNSIWPEWMDDWQ